MGSTLAVAGIQAGLSMMQKMQSAKATKLEADARAAQHRKNANAARARAQREAIETDREAKRRQSALRLTASAGGGAADGSTNALMSQLQGDASVAKRSKLFQGDLHAQDENLSAGFEKYGGKRRAQQQYWGILNDGLTFAEKGAKNGWVLQS